jgi:hypothetical protein
MLAAILLRQHQSVSRGRSPNKRRYSPEKRPSCRKPHRIAISLTRTPLRQAFELPAHAVETHGELALDPSQRAELYDQLEGRAAWFCEAVTTSSGMVTKTPGVGQVYLAIGSTAVGAIGCGYRPMRWWNSSGP